MDAQPAVDPDRARGARGVRPAAIVPGVARLAAGGRELSRPERERKLRQAAFGRTLGGQKRAGKNRGLIPPRLRGGWTRGKRVSGWGLLCKVTPPRRYAPTLPGGRGGRSKRAEIGWA